MNEQQINSKTYQFLDEIGLSLPELFKLIGDNKSTLLALDDTTYKEYINLLENIKSGLGTAQERGCLFEKLIQCLLFSGTQGIFDCKTNVRTTTNEIDLLVTWSTFARMAGLCSAYPYIPAMFICECKNYNEKPISVTYVGKFFSLLKVSKCSLGVMFSQHGISGRGPWSDACGLVKKIALSEKIYILSFNITDLQLIAEKKETFFSLIDQKYQSMQIDVDFSKYISAHECEPQFTKLAAREGPELTKK